MFKKIISLLFSGFSLLLLIIFWDQSSMKVNANENVVPISELIENADVYQNKEICIEAEVIGEIMNRGEYSWINLLDSTGSIGVWITSEMAKEITYTGKYNVKGDYVKIYGLFQDECKLHGGEADIHCNQIVILETGIKQIEKVSGYKLAAMIILMITAIALSIFYYRIYRKTGYYTDESI